jgi:hypothetical protein
MRRSDRSSEDEEDFQVLEDVRIGFVEGASISMSSRRRNAVALLAGCALVVLLIALRQCALESPRKVLLSKRLPDPTPQNEVLPALPTRVPVFDGVRRRATRLRMQREFLALARYQRRALEKVYLDTLQNIYLLEPDYVAQTKADLNWPDELFKLDFEAFQRQRARYRPILEGNAAEIQAWLDDLSGMLVAEVRDAVRGDPAFSRAEKRIREGLGTLDQLMDDFGASLVQDAAAATVVEDSFPNGGVQLDSDQKSAPPLNPSTPEAHLRPQGEGR